jgi:hypothetical protein
VDRPAGCESESRGYSGESTVGRHNHLRGLDARVDIADTADAAADGPQGLPGQPRSGQVLEGRVHAPVRHGRVEDHGLEGIGHGLVVVAPPHGLPVQLPVTVARLPT